jgi:type II secretory pathway pseudopilin PulG
MIFHRRAFSLIEITLALLVTTLLIGSVVFTGRAAIEDARQEKVWRTLSAFLEISAQFDAVKGKYPVSIEEIVSFDARAPLLNPWGNAYVVVPTAASWCVETRVPSGRGDIHQSSVFASVLPGKDGDVLRVCRPIITTL